MSGLVDPKGRPIGALGQLAEPLECGSAGCTRVAVAAFWLEGQAGHIHDCAEHAAQVRAQCAVTSWKPITPGMQCPALACTPAPIANQVPTLLGRVVP